MKAIGFYIVLPFLYFISYLPFPLLYGFSDFLYIIIYHLIRYRKKVIFTNLRKSFPEKSEQEIQQIAKEFYHYFCDIIVETIKSITISKEEILKRCSFKNVEVLNRFYRENRSVIIVLGHYGNWEWAALGTSAGSMHKLRVIYHDLSNRLFDELIYNTRSKFGATLVTMDGCLRDMAKHKEQLTSTALVADQSPGPGLTYWTTFLNQDTPIFLGPEKLSKMFDFPVIFGSTRRIKRGYYEMETILISEFPRTTAEFEITEAHTRLLEQEIIRQPEIWLWSHKRWKHKRP